MTEQGKNRGLIPDSANRFCGVPLGSSYCASSASLAIAIAGAKGPKSALARAMKTNKTFSAWDVVRGARQINRGDGIIWQKGETVFGHYGTAIENWDRTRGRTVEGNTSIGTAGSQSNGDGFYIRKRAIQPTSYMRIVAITPIEYDGTNNHK